MLFSAIVNEGGSVPDVSRDALSTAELGRTCIIMDRCSGADKSFGKSFVSKRSIRDPMLVCARTQLRNASAKFAATATAAAHDKMQTPPVVGGAA
jgi:hypothetical protein